MPFQFPLILIAAIGVFVFSLIYRDLILVLLVFCMLLSPEIIVGNLPGHDIVVRIEDLLLILLGLVWLARAAVDQGQERSLAHRLQNTSFFTPFCLFFRPRAGS